MLFREIIALYSENHMKHINIFSWQNTGILMMKKAVNILTTVLQKVNIK
jgi:hypothetical protein